MVCPYCDNPLSEHLGPSRCLDAWIASVIMGLSNLQFATIGPATQNPLYHLWYTSAGVAKPVPQYSRELSSALIDRLRSLGWGVILSYAPLPHNNVCVELQRDLPHLEEEYVEIYSSSAPLALCYAAIQATEFPTEYIEILVTDEEDEEAHQTGEENLTIESGDII